MVEAFGEVKLSPITTEGAAESLALLLPESARELVASELQRLAHQGHLESIRAGARITQ